MARPRRKTFPLSDLKCYAIVISELYSLPEFKDFDIDNAVINIKERKPKYTAKQENIETAIRNLKKHIEIHGTDKLEQMSKQDMSVLLGISRPTLDRWIEAEIIKRGLVGFHRFFEIKAFTTSSMLESLEELSQE